MVPKDDFSEKNVGFGRNSDRSAQDKSIAPELSERGTNIRKESPWGVLNENLDGSSRNGHNFNLIDEKGLVYDKPDFDNLYDYIKDPIYNEFLKYIRCSDFTKPGYAGFYFGYNSAGDMPIGFNVDTYQALIELASEIVTMVEVVGLHRAIGTMPLFGQLVFELGLGKYTGQKIEETFKSLGFEPAPERCFVFQPDMPGEWFFREFK